MSVLIFESSSTCQLAGAGSYSNGAGAQWQMFQLLGDLVVFRTTERGVRATEGGKEPLNIVSHEPETSGNREDPSKFTKLILHLFKKLRLREKTPTFCII